MALDLARTEALADRFFAALEAGSLADVLACYAPDAMIWHNFDQITVDPAGNVPGLEMLFANYPARSYEAVRRIAMPGQLVQQYVLRLTRADGVILDWPGCIIFEMDDRGITRLDEYVDIASLNKSAQGD